MHTFVSKFTKSGIVKFGGKIHEFDGGRIETEDKAFAEFLRKNDNFAEIKQAKKAEPAPITAKSPEPPKKIKRKRSR